jgi:hypothetical protein
MPASVLLAHAALLARLITPAPPGAAAFPFAVGETLSYDASLGYLPVGRATATVGRAREGGADAFVFAFAGEGGPPGIRVRYELTSWTRSSGFASLRFHRRLMQGNKVEEQRYQIVPDSSRYREEGGGQDWVAPRDALDELPRDLHEALEMFEKDAVVKAALGEHLTERFLEAKRNEVQEYNRQVSRWEIESYLGRY